MTCNSRRSSASVPSLKYPRAYQKRQSDPKEAASVYEKLKKEFPNTAVSEEADRGLETLAPKS